MLKKLSNTDEIWVLHPNTENRKSGAEYAAITLPWTFNRMSLNTSCTGQLGRGLNIAKGIVAQAALHSALEAKGIEAIYEIKSYRKDDLFDFRIDTSSGQKKIDVKSVIHYSDYESVGRDPLTPHLILKNKSYSGPDWRHFFPMLIPHTQINQDKEIYCFCIADSVDFRNSIRRLEQQAFPVTTYPFGEHLQFFASKTLCNQREISGKGVFLNISYVSNDLLSTPNLKLRILGEWDGKSQIIDVEIEKNSTANDIGPFSCISAFQLMPEIFNDFFGQLYISIEENELPDKVLNSAKQNINQIPSNPLIFAHDSFRNLMLPENYIIYVLGWIPKHEFLNRLTCPHL